MSEKVQAIKNGENISVNENIIVINDLSVAEKKELEKPVAEEIVAEEVATPETEVENDVVENTIIPSDIPEVTQEIEKEVPEFNFPSVTDEAADVPVFPIEQTPAEQEDNEQPEENKVMDFPQIPIAENTFTPETTIENNSEVTIPNYSPFENTYNYEPQKEEPSNVYNFGDYTFANNDMQNNVESYNEPDFSVSGVYKTTSDVDSAKSAFLKDIEKAYDENIAAPTKTLVSLLNDFKTWGNEVTSQGLNRPLFEKFDELSARYDGMKVASYNDDNVNNFDLSSYNDDENNNNYGGYGGFAA